MNHQKNSLKKTVVVGTILVSSAFVFQVSAQTWANPACAPTGCNTPTPINVSGTAQTKAGNFILGGRMEVKNTAPQLWLNENDQTSATLGLWRFLGWEGNIHLYRNLSATKDFATQSRVISILGANNNIGLGVVPTTKLDIDGQVKIRGGAPGLNKILASDADGLASWKTVSEILTIPPATDTSKWSNSGLHILNKNTGGVGIGTGGTDYLQYAKLFVGGSSVTTGSAIVQGNLAAYGTLTVPNNTISAAASTGRVGIGTNIPDFKLHVVGSSANGEVFRSQFSNTNPAGATNIQISSGGTDSASIGISGPNRNYPNSSFNNWGWLHNGGGGWAFYAGRGDGLSNLRMAITPGGNVGIGNTNPSSLLSLKGNSEKVAELKIEGTNDTTNNSIGLNVDSARNAHVILDRGNTGQTSYVRHATGGTTDWYAGINARQNSDYQISNTFNGEVGQLTIKKSNGNVGINTNLPTAKLDVNGTLRLRGGAPGLNKILASDADGLSTWKTPAEIGIGGGPWSILGSNIFNNNAGNVGIGKNNPVTKLDVLGSGYFSSALGVAGKAIVGGAEIKNTAPELWLNESDETSAGLGLWRFQGWNGNFHLYRNTSAAKDFSTQSRALSILGANNYVGIGIAPTAKLDVDGQVKIRGGAPGLNKILASDADGLSTWKTPAEIGIGGGSNWTVTNNDLTNKNTGNVGIGVINNVPLTKFHVLGTTLLSGNTAIVGNAEITGTADIWDTLRIRGGAPAVNKILASTNSSGNALWKTPSELGLNSSWTNPDINNNISNTNTGNVGVGITSPISKLGVKSASNGRSVLSAFNSLDTSIFNVYVKDDGQAHVGINTGTGVNPASALTVNGQVTIDDDTAEAGKVLTALNNRGDANWELPPFPKIATATFLKSDGVNSNFVTALNYDSKNPTTMSRPSYRVEENDVHLFFPPSWGNLDYGVMTCPADTVVISGGVTCDSDRAIKVNTIYPYYNGGVPNEWMVSCGNELSFIHSMHVTCMSVD